MTSAHKLSIIIPATNPGSRPGYQRRITIGDTTNTPKNAKNESIQLTLPHAYKGLAAMVMAPAAMSKTIGLIVRPYHQAHSPKPQTTLARTIDGLWPVSSKKVNINPTLKN